MANKAAETPAIKLGGRSEETVECAECQKKLTVGERHSYQGKDGADVYFCENCVGKINDALAVETQNPGYPGAIVLGLLAGLAGGAAWYGFTILTQYQIGYLGIGLGYLIAMAVSYGAGKKRGLPLQVIAVVITLIALLLSELFIFSHFAVQSINTEFGGDVLATGIAGEFNLLKDVLADPAWRQDFMTIFAETMITPMGLLIWAISLYTAFRTIQPRKI